MNTKGSKKIAPRPVRVWVKRDTVMGPDGTIIPGDGAMCLEGYPIRIKMIPGRECFQIEVDGRSGFSSWANLRATINECNRYADEFDWFNPPVSEE